MNRLTAREASAIGIALRILLRGDLPAVDDKAGWLAALELLREAHPDRLAERLQQLISTDDAEEA